MQIEKIIAGIPAELIRFVDHTVTTEGRSKVIKIAEQMKTQGRPSANDITAGEMIALYNDFLIRQTEQGIRDEIAAEIAANAAEREKLEKEFADREKALLEKYDLHMSASQKKKNIFEKGIAHTGICLMVMVIIFAFAINFINLDEFFGKAMALKFGGILSTVILTFISALISISFAFFATLRNKEMVRKTLWILPADLLLSFLIANNMFEGLASYWLTTFQVVAFGLYVAQVFFIVLEISNLFIGTGIADGKEAEHYESVFNKIFA